jgi:hypothetical protein
MASRRGKLKRNFAAYAQMEAANVVLVPGLALWFGWPLSRPEYIAMVLAVIACAGLLVVGAVYWRAVDRRLKSGMFGGFDRTLGFAAAAQRPLAFISLAAAAAVLIAFVNGGATRAVIAAAVLALLAALEYVNYYHRQLQVFDNMADFRRLLATRQLKRAHLARELAAFRQRRP